MNQRLKIISLVNPFLLKKSCCTKSEDDFAEDLRICQFILSLRLIGLTRL